MKRLFDILFSCLALILLSPLFLVISLAIVLGSKGGIFYAQDRVGKGEKNFRMYKFRSMRPASDREGLLSLGKKDQRITGAGHFLRRYKLDELPQLWNILIGDMSFVGPRPEVPHYVQHFTPQQKQTLRVRPGLTGYAALDFIDEDELLGKSATPEETYLQDILPKKLHLSQKYIEEQSFINDLSIIWKTILKILT